MSTSNPVTLFWQSRTRVFDLDGTLVDTLPDLLEALNLALADLHLPEVDGGLVRASLHGGLEGSASAALRFHGAPEHLHAQLVALYERHYQAVSGAGAVPYEGVSSLLQMLAQRGEKPAVCTNKTQDRAVELLQSLGLLDHIATVVGADTCARRKPYPDPLLHALRLLGGEPISSVLVGDSALDVQCARAARVPCLFFASGYGRAEEIDAGPGLLQFGAYQELLDRAG